ncbi:peptidyl-tRNA hydrolase [Streptomyces sp. WELS2]|uniref:peptidyl-tRNA hydrolase n=1 Tax=Streptomyces sp. WELS2 TaxID=2749435 RepID=UPI002867B053|nr:peptidyl-tRNA hydrolase [Streptomyces sp. WELS2]
MSHDPAPSSARPLRDAAPDPRDEAPQYVLPLVVRIERAAPPARTDALETAARAVLVLLADERAHGDGEWAEAVRNWEDARIRKVVRRARGAEWRRAEALPGITLTGKSAEVRVFPPIPLDGWPKDLAKLQVSGTELDDPEPPVATDPAQPVLWLNPDLEMSAGKAMAQAGHGAQLAWWALPEAERTAWHGAGFPLSVRTATPTDWPHLTTAGDVCGEDMAYGRRRAARPHPSAHRGRHMNAAREDGRGLFRLRGQAHPLDPPP